MTAFDPNEHPRNNQGEFTDKGKGGKPATTTRAPSTGTA